MPLLTGTHVCWADPLKLSLQSEPRASATGATATSKNKVTRITTAPRRFIALLLNGTRIADPPPG